MRALNYNHLYYFWAVAKAGSLKSAGEQLRLSASTLSVQLKHLERSLGAPLFQAGGSRSNLTAEGAELLRLADQIFSSARRLADAFVAYPSETALLCFGYSYEVPKLLVQRALGPVLDGRPAGPVWCKGVRGDKIIEEVQHDLVHLAIIARPPPSVRGLTARLIAESPVEFVATKEMAATLRRGFPGSLRGADLVLPTPGLALRDSIDSWLKANRVSPRIAAESDDSALLCRMAQAGFGAAPVSAAASEELCRLYALAPVGRAEEVVEQYWVVVKDKRLKSPHVRRVLDLLLQK